MILSILNKYTKSKVVPLFHKFASITAEKVSFGHILRGSGTVFNDLDPTRHDHVITLFLIRVLSSCSTLGMKFYRELWAIMSVEFVSLELCRVRVILLCAVFFM